MSQDPPPPGDPILKPPEPVLDIAERARIRLETRAKKQAELKEREAKRQQEIRDQEAREAEKQKKREQRKMEKKESEESLKLFNQSKKDGSSEPSTSQPRESKPERKERPAIPPAAGAPPPEVSQPADPIPALDDRNSRRKNREQHLRSRFTESSEDKSETKEVAPAVPKRKSSDPCKPRVLEKRPAPPDFSKGPQLKIAPTSSEIRHIVTKAATSSLSTQKLDTGGSKPENVSQAKPVQAQKAVPKVTSTPVSSAPKTPATIQATPVSKPTKQAAPSSSIKPKTPVSVPVVKQPPTQNSKLVSTTIPAAPGKDSRSGTAPSGRPVPTPQPTVKKGLSATKQDETTVTPSVAKPKTAPIVQHVNQPTPPAVKKTKVPTVESKPEPKPIVKPPHLEKKKSDTQTPVQTVTKHAAPSSSVPKAPASESVVKQPPTQNPKLVSSTIPSAPQKGSRSDTAPSVRPAPIPQPTAKKASSVPKQDKKPATPSVAETKADPTALAQPTPTAVKKAKVTSVIAPKPEPKQTVKPAQPEKKKSDAQVPVQTATKPAAPSSIIVRKGPVSEPVLKLPPTENPKLVSSTADPQKDSKPDTAPSGRPAPTSQPTVKKGLSDPEKDPKPVAPSTKVAPPAQQQNLSKFAMATRKSLQQLDFKQMAIDVLHVTSRQRRGDFRNALINVRDRLVKNLSNVEKIDIQFVLKRLDELDKADMDQEKNLEEVATSSVKPVERIRKSREERLAEAESKVVEMTDEKFEDIYNSVMEQLKNDDTAGEDLIPAPLTRQRSYIPSKDENPILETMVQVKKFYENETPTVGNVLVKDFLARIRERNKELRRESSAQKRNRSEKVDDPKDVPSTSTEAPPTEVPLTTMEAPPTEVPLTSTEAPPTEESTSSGVPSSSILAKLIEDDPQIEEYHSPEPMEQTEQKSPTPEKEKTPEGIAEEEQKEVHNEDVAEDFQQLLVVDNEEKKGDVISPMKTDSETTKNKVKNKESSQEEMVNMEDPTSEEHQERDNSKEEDVPEPAGEDIVLEPRKPISESDLKTDPGDPDFNNIYPSGDGKYDGDILDDNDSQDISEDSFLSESEEEKRDMMDVEEPELVGLAESPQVEEKVSPEFDHFSPLLESDVPCVAEEVTLETEEPFETESKKRRNAKRQRDEPGTSRRETDYMSDFVDSDDDDSVRAGDVGSDIDEKLSMAISGWEEKKAAEEEADRKSKKKKRLSSFEEMERLVTLCDEYQANRRRRRQQKLSKMNAGLHDSDDSDLGESSDSSVNRDLEQLRAMYEIEKERREINSSKPPPEKLMPFGERCVLRYQESRKRALEYKKDDKNEEKLAAILEGKKEETKKRAPRGKKGEEKVKQQRRKPNEPDMRDELEKDIERARKQEEDMKKDVKMVLTEISKDPKIAERQCELCFGVFVNKNKRERHMKTHTDQIDANCDICGAPMKFSYNLVQHLKKCAQKLTIPCDEKELREYYPRYMAQFEQFRADNLSDPPDLPADFKYDDMGFIVGVDDHIPFTYTNYEFKRVMKDYKKNQKDDEEEKSDIEEETDSDDD